MESGIGTITKNWKIGKDFMSSGCAVSAKVALSPYQESPPQVVHDPGPSRQGQDGERRGQREGDTQEGQEERIPRILLKLET